MLVTWLQYRFQISRSNASLAALPCNLSNRPLATCAHRANAAELLKLLQGSGGRSDASKKQQLGSLQEQMTLLWSNGMTCFDLDVVQLAGSDFVIGHPVDLAHKASRSSSSNKKLAPEQLHKHDLAELRAAGVDAAAAPALHTVLRHFAQLQRNKPPGSNSNKSKQQGHGSSSKLAAVSVVEAAEKRDSWQQVPLLALELKGPASISTEAWLDVISAVKSAGITDSTVLWLRQPPGAAAAAASVRRVLLEGSGTAAGASISDRSSSSDSVVLQLAQSLRKHTTTISSSSSSKTRPNLKSDGPLLGLIVPDKLMSAGASSMSATGAPVR
jgi:hypothetical protein